MAYRPYFRPSSRFEYPRRNRRDDAFFIIAIVLGFCIFWIGSDRSDTNNPVHAPTTTQNAN